MSKSVNINDPRYGKKYKTHASDAKTQATVVDKEFPNKFKSAIGGCNIYTPESEKRIEILLNLTYNQSPSLEGEEIMNEDYFDTEPVLEDGIDPVLFNMGD